MPISLFLYKNRIKATIEAHKHSGSVAVRHGGGLKFGHFWTQSGAAETYELLSKYQISKLTLATIKGSHQDCPQ